MAKNKLSQKREEGLNMGSHQRKYQQLFSGPKQNMKLFYIKRILNSRRSSVRFTSERIRINGFVSGGLNDGEAKKRRERNFEILFEMSTERLQAMEDRNPDLIS